jgi:hypothetical protein
MNRRLLAAGIVLMALAGVTEVAAKRSRGDDPLRNVPAVRITGKAQSCIPIARIRDSQVRNDWTIDFLSGSRQGWRTTLPHRCSSLGFEQRFEYETSLSQLCSTDIIHVLHSAGPGLQRGASCGLGQFVPIELKR